VKLLLDEQIPRKLASLFPKDWDVMTVRAMGWSGTSNGALLQLATDRDFDAIVTADKNLQYQQNPKSLPIPVVVLGAISTRLIDLSPLIPQAIELLSTNLTPGVYRIDPE
jgi:predicted nuclease of predicted toxin-antitoxin system